VINNGIDLDRFAFNPYVRNRIRDNLHIKNSEFVIGHVGRFCYQKNQEYIIEILHRLVDKGIDAKAVFIGSGETYDTIKRQADEYDLKNKTIFVGNVNNVNDYMQAFDVFLFPSRFEGLGIVAIEAQASGLPVVVSEKVPNDVLITNKVVRLPLSDINGWIDHIVEVKNSMTNVLRCSETDSLRNAGYDIVDTIRRIESIYGK
jgi:glycosyltransferase involved in cell wall biosynthesis